MVSLASFSPTISTSAPSRRNFSTTMSSAETLEISQICALLTSMTTFSTDSRKSNAVLKSSTEAKNNCPSTR